MLDYVVAITLVVNTIFWGILLCSSIILHKRIRSLWSIVLIFGLLTVFLSRLVDSSGHIFLTEQSTNINVDDYLLVVFLWEQILFSAGIVLGTIGFIGITLGIVRRTS